MWKVVTSAVPYFTTDSSGFSVGSLCCRVPHSSECGTAIKSWIARVKSWNGARGLEFPVTECIPSVKALIHNMAAPNPRSDRRLACPAPKRRSPSVSQTRVPHFSWFSRSAACPRVRANRRGALLPGQPRPPVPRESAKRCGRARLQSCRTFAKKLGFSRWGFVCTTSDVSSA